MDTLHNRNWGLENILSEINFLMQWANLEATSFKGVYPLSLGNNSNYKIHMTYFQEGQRKLQLIFFQSDYR